MADMAEGGFCLGCRTCVYPKTGEAFISALADVGVSPPKSRTNARTPGSKHAHGHLARFGEK